MATCPLSSFGPCGMIGETSLSYKCPFRNNGAVPGCRPDPAPRKAVRERWPGLFTTEHTEYTEVKFRNELGTTKPRSEEGHTAVCRLDFFRVFRVFRGLMNY
jgi:hypothetical protein